MISLGDVWLAVIRIVALVALMMVIFGVLGATQVAVRVADAERVAFELGEAFISSKWRQAGWRGIGGSFGALPTHWRASGRKTSLHSRDRRIIRVSTSHLKMGGYGVFVLATAGRQHKNPMYPLLIR